MKDKPSNRLFLAVIAAAAAILAYQLFITPVVGLADQGDFIRTIGRFSYGPQNHGTLEYKYVEPKYVPDSQYRSPYWEQESNMLEYLFVGPALLLNKLVSKDGALDITVMGLIHALAFLAVFARLLWVARRHRAYPLVWIGALVALTDAGYAVYWNSFYQEAASCIFLLLLMAEAVEIASHRRGQSRERAPLVAVGRFVGFRKTPKRSDQPDSRIVYIPPGVFHPIAPGARDRGSGRLCHACLRGL